jgi:hypothetical protein
MKHKNLIITFYNGKELTIPADALALAEPAPNRRLGGGTSWAAEFLLKNSAENNYKFLISESSMRQYCLRNLQRKIEGKYVSFFEMLAGAGMTSRGIFEVDPEKTYLNDYDDACVKILQANYSKHVTQVDLGDAKARQKLFKVKADLWFADFNNFTLHKYAENNKAFGECGYKEMVTDIFNFASKYIILNDCTVFLLNKKRLNTTQMDKPALSGYDIVNRTLSKSVATKEEFLTELQAFYHKEFPEWWLTDVEWFNASSYTLFSKQKKKPTLTIHKNETADLKHAPIILNVSEPSILEELSTQSIA